VIPGLLVSLLALGPPAPVRACLRERAPAIAAQAAEAAAATGVRPALLLAVGWAETHLGCDAREGGNWGAPISRHRRHVAGRAIHAARALAWGLRRCRTELGALEHFRCGLCVCRAHRGYHPRAVLRIAARLERGDRQ